MRALSSLRLRDSAFDTFSYRSVIDGKVVGDFAADIVVEDTVIVELKSVRRLVVAHEIQLVNYLVATGKPVGLVLNFGERQVEVKRKGKNRSQRQTSSGTRRQPVRDKLE